MFWNHVNRSKLFSGRNKKRIEVMEYLVSVGAEFLSSILLSKIVYIKLYGNIVLTVLLHG
jgi:hypothetical protein